LTRLAEELVSSYRAVRASHDLVSLSEQRWRAVFDHSAAGIALLTRDGQIISLNEAFRRMLGLGETAEPTRLDEIAFSDDLADMSQQLAQLGNSGEKEFRTERRLRRTDGATLWVDASVSMVPANGTSAALVLCIAEDITARRQAESDLAKAQAQLSRVTRANAMGELAASIAHELNQPLAAICTNAQAFQRWLTAEPPNEPEAIAAVNRIARDAARASDVIARIRQFLGRESAPMEAVPVGDVLRDVTSMLANFAAAHDVTVRLHGPEAAQSVHGDRVQLEQVFFNIIINAVEAMTASPRPRIVDVCTERRGGSVLVEVRDYGAGIDPADVNRIFEPFYTTKSCGLGMGLAISRSIIDAHGGQLSAATPDGPGTTFVITLPVADDHGTGEREPAGART
jgi:PAS domain S-box-containing protein